MAAIFAYESSLPEIIAYSGHHQPASSVILAELHFAYKQLDPKVHSEYLLNLQTTQLEQIDDQISNCEQQIVVVLSPPLKPQGKVQEEKPKLLAEEAAPTKVVTLSSKPPKKHEKSPKVSAALEVKVKCVEEQFKRDVKPQRRKSKVSEPLVEYETHQDSLEEQPVEELAVENTSLEELKGTNYFAIIVVSAALLVSVVVVVFVGRLVSRKRRLLSK